MRHEPGPWQDAEDQPFPLTPTPIHVPDDVLDDLRPRLELTRWPDDAGNEDWYYGVNRAYLQELVDYWRTGYDWRKVQAAINAYQHFVDPLADPGADGGDPAEAFDVLPPRSPASRIPPRPSTRT